MLSSKGTWLRPKQFICSPEDVQKSATEKDWCKKHEQFGRCIYRIFADKNAIKAMHFKNPDDNETQMRRHYHLEEEKTGPVLFAGVS